MVLVTLCYNNTGKKYGLDPRILEFQFDFNIFVKANISNGIAYASVDSIRANNFEVNHSLITLADRDYDGLFSSLLDLVKEQVNYEEGVGVDLKDVVPFYQQVS